jgi:hypothetical protein
VFCAEDAVTNRAVAAHPGLHQRTFCSVSLGELRRGALGCRVSLEICRLRDQVFAPRVSSGSADGEIL